MKKILRNIGLAVGIFFFSIVLYLYIFDNLLMPYLIKVPKVQVPDLHNLTAAQAEQRLRARGLRQVIRDSLYHETMEAGMIITQHPQPDRYIKKGRRVFVEISRGIHLYEVPDLSGRSIREAKLRLAQVKLQIGRITYTPSKTVPRGVILAQAPNAGTGLAIGDSVALQISSGQPNYTQVPDLSGLLIQTVEDTLRAYNLVLGEISEQADASLPPGTVVAHRPLAGRSVQAETPIDLVLSVLPLQSDSPDQTFPEDSPNPTSPEE